MRKTAAILALLLALSLLAGCGGVSLPALPTVPVATPSPTRPPVVTYPPATPEAEPTATPVPTLEPFENAAPVGDEEMVRVRDSIVDIRIDLRYGGVNNFTGEAIYDFQDAYLRQGTVKKLAKVQEALKEQGYGLLIWDAYRPASAQYKLWKAMPDGDYITDPKEGYSSHSSGGTVDVCLVLPNGSIPEMPSLYDAFDATADRDYSDVSETAAANAGLLEQAMVDAGFVAYPKEWWHFMDSDEYGYEDVSELKLPTGWQVSCMTACEEYVTMRKTPDYAGEELRRIQNEERLVIVSFIGDFVRVRYYDQEGFVSKEYIRYGSLLQEGVTT